MIVNAGAPRAMASRRAFQAALALCITLLCAGCGGGDSGQADVLAAALCEAPRTAQRTAILPAQRAQQQQRQQQQAVQTVAPTPDQLMNWAQAMLPSLFPTNQITQAIPGYSYRYYPNSGNFIAVASDGGVYVLLGASGQLLYAGTLASFSCAVLPNCGTVPMLELLAGATGGVGYQDGPGPQARFNGNAGLAMDRNGNLVVADRNNNAIRLVQPSGLTTTLAGNPAERRGFVDGSGSAARFAGPTAVALNPAGDIYVVDPGNNAIRKLSAAGVVSTVATSASGATGIAVDGAGAVYLSTASTIKRLLPNGAMPLMAGSVTQTGNVDAAGEAARFQNISSLAADSAGNLYAFDNYSVRRITPAGVVSTVAGKAGTSGSADGMGTAARFQDPAALSMGSDGSLYIAYGGSVRKLAANGQVSSLAGSFAYLGFVDGASDAARFYTLRGVASDTAGNVYVSDMVNAAVRKISPAGTVSTLAGEYGTQGSIDARGAAARFNYPTGVAADKAGNLYVADSGNRTIRKVAPDGTTTTLAGQPGVNAAPTDGQGSAAIFGGVAAITLDAAGNLYVVDSNMIRKVTPAGVVTTLAGQRGVIGLVDGTGSAAQFFYPSGLAVDAGGNIFVADTGNQAIRKITPAGVVSTFYKASLSPQGYFTMGEPYGIAIDGAGNLYVANGNRVVLRFAPGGGAPFTLAGRLGIAGNDDGYAGTATFRVPTGVALDAQGNVYVIDAAFSFYQDVPVAQTVRKISGSTVTTIAGQPDKMGLTLGPAPGLLKGLKGIAWANGKLALVSDQAILTLSNQP